MRPKKRGRKRRRITMEPVRKYLTHERIPLSRERNTLTKAARSARLRTERDVFNQKQEWVLVPSGPLIMIADAIVYYSDKKWHTWFFIFVRSIYDEDAVILPPYYAGGRETADEWSEAMACVPQEVLHRVKALVCDGHRGLTREALWRGWLIQRCHFHLLKAIQARRSRWTMGRHQEEALEIHALVNRMLKQSNDHELTQTLSRIEEIGWATKSVILKKVLRGFVTSAEDYRTYLANPELNLPTTSNTAESLNALIQALSSRTHGFRTVASLNAWIIALCKARGTMKCRGGNQQN